jgi:hypothetical protein
MTHEGIEYVIRVGIGRNEWALLIRMRDLLPTPLPNLNIAQWDEPPR